MVNKRRFRRTTLLSIGLAAFLIGLVGARWQQIWLGSSWLAVCLPFIAMLRRKTVVSLLAVIIIGSVLGLWRGGMVLARISQYQQFIGQRLTVQGVVRDDPVYDDQGRLDFRISGVAIKGRSLPGEVRVRGFINDIRRGDTIAASGNLGSGFANYQAEMSFAEIKVLSRSASWIESARREFFAATYNALPEPHASLGLGFLVGLRSALPEDFDEQLRVAGLTHIVVASGYNLTILVRLSRRLLAKRSKYQAFAGSVALVLGFIAVTGASPSIIRAAIVTLLSLGAWYFGRKIHPVLVILLGAALTAGFSPLYIWFDLGWWLSFLAFAGVLLIAPLLTRQLFKGARPPLIPQIAIETTAAQAMAVPLIFYVFGDVSLVALAANVLVVAFIPFAMITTFAAGLASLASPLIGAWIALPARFLLGYIIAITQLLSRPAWASQAVVLGAAGMALLYVSVFLVCLGLYRRTGMNFGEAPSVVQ